MPSQGSRTVVVVGHGMVGHRFCERLVARDEARSWRIVVFAEEARPAYDRVHLSDCFAGRDADDLALADPAWYAANDIALHLDEPVVDVDRTARTVRTACGRLVTWDALVLATGSRPFVPPLGGLPADGVLTYRTLEDVAAIQARAATSRRAVVIGGGLLGLEAAKAVKDAGLETHVVEAAPRLMPRQIDGGGGEALRRAIRALGVHVHCGVAPTTVEHDDGGVRAVILADGRRLDADLVVVSAGIRPRDELARACGLAVGERGGIVVDPMLRTSDPAISAIGECALVNGAIYGLVAPGYAMADACAAVLCGADASFTGADCSTQLKLLGVDVASVGDPFADETAGASAQRLVVDDRVRGVYQKLVLTADGSRLIGAVLVGDASAYPALLQACRDGLAVPERPHELLFGAGSASGDAAGDEALVCSCNNVRRGEICRAIDEQGLDTVAAVKACTQAGTGCGGCVPVVSKLLDAALARAGQSTARHVCEHFAYTRQELFEIVKLGRIQSFDALLSSHGRGAGCEVCRPVVASILASTWNDFVLEHATIQDTNDRFLANIQRGGTYSVVPRIPGGEITPDKLIVLGEVAKRFDLYVKITGGQRIDLLGARVEQLPDIWEALVDAGFESGHAYGKAMRTVKSCVGSTWCRYGVQDSTALAIRLEERYRGLRAPHKLKSAVSGCIRECAEAQSKDFGVIATERGWNLYVGGNGGSHPRHAELLASDVDEATLVQLIDRFLMYYLQTANPLERTARWIERLDGGLEHVKRVVVDDALGIGARLEADMQQLVDGYACEWAAVVRDPMRRREFLRAAADGGVGFVRERGQKRPVDWPTATPPPPVPPRRDGRWVRLAAVADVPRDGGITVRQGDVEIALFHFASRDAWYATQAACPHRKDAVLGRGLLGTDGDTPKVACPMHKKTFSLETGEGLSDPHYCVRTYPVDVRGDAVWVQLPARVPGERGVVREAACVTA